MATKKQKRERGLAKREAFMKQYREDGLAALARSHKERDEKAAKAAAEIKKLKQGLSIAVAMEKLKSGVDDVTVGEFLEAANRMMPVLVDHGNGVTETILAGPDGSFIARDSETIGLAPNFSG